MCDTRDEFSLGIDIGSTTVKVVLLDKNGKQIYEKYQRHFADVRRTTLELLKEAVLIVGDAPCTAAVTGSGGLNLAKYTGTAFVQEVIAVTAAVQENIADADVVIFDPEKIRDGATFDDPMLPPSGIDYVLIGGEIAAKDCRIVKGDLGTAIRKRS